MGGRCRSPPPRARRWPQAAGVGALDAQGRRAEGARLSEEDRAPRGTGGAGRPLRRRSPLLSFRASRAPCSQPMRERETRDGASTNYQGRRGSAEHERYGFLPSWAATASFYWAYGPYCNISQTTHAVPLYILLYFSQKNTYYYIEILMFVTKIMVIPWNTRVCP